MWPHAPLSWCKTFLSPMTRYDNKVWVFNHLCSVSQLMIPFMFSRFPHLFLQNFHLLFISQFLSFILTDDDSKYLRICINSNISSFRFYNFLALLDQQMNLNQNYHVELIQNGFWPKKYLIKSVIALKSIFSWVLIQNWFLIQSRFLTQIFDVDSKLV